MPAIISSVRSRGLKEQLTRSTPKSAELCHQASNKFKVRHEQLTNWVYMKLSISGQTMQLRPIDGTTPCRDYVVRLWGLGMHGVQYIIHNLDGTWIQ